MPVPVPKKQPAHPVFKSNNLLHDGQQNQFQSLNTVLPAFPVGLPPSFGTREEWINSLPDWRRSKPRQSWGDDTDLAPADTFLTLTKGSFKPFAQRQPTSVDFDAAVEADDEMSPSSHAGMTPDAGLNQMDVDHRSAAMPAHNHQEYERGAFTPVFEDQSPVGQVHQNDSDVITPFAEFVDRAVFAVLNLTSTAESKRQSSQRHPIQPVKDDAPQEVVTPTATAGYKKLAEPLSEWVANFIWRACTTNVNPSSALVPLKQYPAYPPSQLGTAIHSLLLSTLLQPSAVLLALWYIARLPISFLPVGLHSDQSKEVRFRTTLLGEDSDVAEAQAPFRLAVIGCMLANKWLDDHTFSNKTWHTISNIPAHLLNHLESLALDIFGYDLSVSSADWSQWLDHLVSHHTYISSPVYPQPISRPSASPQVIVRKAIEEIIQAQAARGMVSEHPQPVFLGVEERRQEKLDWEQAVAVADNVLSDIDLDENGPLRDEYLPKKRSGPVNNTHSRVGSTAQAAYDENTDRQKTRQIEIEKTLPPPAKWSPAADEPILRDRNRANGHYVAVQPPAPVQFQVVSAYPRNQDLYPMGWPVPPPNMTMGYVFDLHVPAPIMQVATSDAAALYAASCPLILPLNPSHSRSQSLCVYDQTHEVQQHHMRSYSQSAQYYLPHSLDLADSAQAHWAGARGQNEFAYPQPLPSIPAYCGMGVNNGYQPTWLQAA